MLWDAKGQSRVLAAKTEPDTLPHSMSSWAQFMHTAASSLTRCGNLRYAIGSTPHAASRAAG